VIDFSVRKVKGGPLGCPFCIDKTLALGGYFLLKETCSKWGCDPEYLLTPLSQGILENGHD
jgi:hypothetical protein